jgi:uncharacterized protein
MTERSPSIPPVSDDELADVPVFPLPRLVFFPHTQLPLHLFEPRYRAMGEHCLAGGSSLVAVVQLAPGWESHYEGQPDVRPVAGLGRILGHERRADGTHDLLLQGIARVRLRELPLAKGGYRRARATVIEDVNADAVKHEDLVAMHACGASVASLVRRKHPSFDLGVTPEMGPGRALDIIADRLVAEPEERQAILEAIDVPTRANRVLDALSSLLVELSEERRALS